MKAVMFTPTRGEVWAGKLDAVPRIGERVFINNKQRHGWFNVKQVTWEVDQKQVMIDLEEE